MPRITYTPGPFTLIVGNTHGASDPSKNGSEGIPPVTMQTYTYQSLVNNAGSGVNGSVAGSISNSTASFQVMSSVLTSTGYFYVHTNGGTDTVTVTLTGIPVGSDPLVIGPVDVGMDANATVDALKVAMDSDLTLMSLFRTTALHDTPEIDKAKLIVTALKEGESYNLTMSTTVPDGSDFRIQDGCESGSGTTNVLSGGDNTVTKFSIGTYTFYLNDVRELRLFDNFPALVNTWDSNAAMAEALATAITRLPGFSATSDGTTVNILGPVGLDSGICPFEIHQIGVFNFTSVTPDDGFLAAGGPSIGAPVIS